jgi:LPS export ABC transporter protein LptC
MTTQRARGHGGTGAPRWIRLLRAPVLLCACALGLWDCGGDRGVANVATAADSADQVMWGVKQYLTKNGVQQAYLKADSALEYEASGRVDLRKITVTFFTAEGVQQSVLTAETGVYWMRTEQMSARGNVVVVRTSDHATLRTSFLQYDQTKNQVTTDQPYVADKGTQHVEGDQGFTCDPGFTVCTTQHARGNAGRLVMPGP